MRGRNLRSVRGRTFRAVRSGGRAAIAVKFERGAGAALTDMAVLWRGDASRLRRTEGRAAAFRSRISRRS
jgi:hypothetical protein